MGKYVSIARHISYYTNVKLYTTVLLSNSFMKADVTESGAFRSEETGDVWYSQWSRDRLSEPEDSSYVETLSTHLPTKKFMFRASKWQKPILGETL